MAKIYGTPIMAGGAGGVSDTLPPMVTNLAAVAGNQQITATYKNPISDALAGVLVVYKTGSYPTKPTDGNKVDAGLSEKAILEGLENGIDYYIRVFPYNAKKQYQTLIDGSTTTARPSEGPKQVTDLKVTGSGANPVLTWKNPTDDPTYHETVVIQKVDSAPTSISDGTEIYRGTGETTTANGLEQLVNYYFGVFTINTEGGTRGPVVSDVYSYDFPSEPTEFQEIQTFSESNTFTIPEDGWFLIVALGKSGNGGNGYGKVNGYKNVYLAGGGSGGTGSFCEYLLKGYKNQILTVTVDTVSSRIDMLSESLISAGAGGNGSAPGEGSAGIAEGKGESICVNGKSGNPGESGNYSSARADGGMSSSSSYTSEIYPSLSFQTHSGAGGYANTNDGEHVTTSNGSYGLAGYVKIYRGNTNTPAPSAVSTLSLIPTDSTLEVDWKNSGDPVQTGTMLVYNTNHVPTSVNDGVSVDIPAAQAAAATFAVDGEEQQADTKNQSYAITGLTNNKPVYVALFPYDANKKYGIPKTDVEIPRVHSWYDTQRELQAEVATVKAEMADYQQYYVTTQEVLK